MYIQQMNTRCLTMQYMRFNSFTNYVSEHQITICSKNIPYYAYYKC